MFIFEKVVELDFYEIDGSGAHASTVFKALQKAMQVGQLELVVELARRAAQDRPARQDLQTLVGRLQAQLMPAPMPQAGAGVAGSVAGSASGPEPPPYLEASIALLGEGPRKMIGSLRPKLREVPHKPYNLPGRYHLSPSEGHRLLAVLALEAEPDSMYLRWLSERVTVEPPNNGLVAAQALTTAALRNSGSALREVRIALRDAVDRLDELTESDDPNSVGFDIGARKRQLTQALTLADLKASNRIWVLEADEFHKYLDGASSAFDRAGVEQFCLQRLQSPLRFLANPDDPPELILVALVLLACDKGWLPDLVRATIAEKPTVPIFATIAQRHASAFAG